MKEWFKKIKLNITLFFHGLFQGLRSADETMLSQVSGEEQDGQEVSHKLEINSVYNDLLREKKTQEVAELIDMSYRVAREADKYEVTLIGDLGDDSVNSDRALSAVAVKKVAMKFDKHPEVFNERGYHVTLIQDNRQIQNTGVWSATVDDFKQAINTNGNDSNSLFELAYDGFTPRFRLENFLKKLVLRETKAGKVKADLYLPLEAGQFTKTDAILIAELHRIQDEKLKKTDFLDIQSVEFVTDRAYGAENLIRYKLYKLTFKKISQFDGSFVLTFTVDNVNTYDIVEAHKTKTLDQKYNDLAPKGGSISVEDVGAIERRNKKLKELNKA